ncbi:hypothetical protein V8E52_007968 [Russula decolorans]
MRAKIAHHGEKPGGIWTAINKEKKPRDLILRLRIPDTEPPQYERSSARMAELAKNYHESLQHAGLHTRGTSSRRPNTNRNVLDSQKLTSRNSDKIIKNRILNRN